MIGAEPKLMRLTFGAIALSGSLTACSALFTFCSALSMSSEKLNSATTAETESPEVALTRLTPATPRSAFSTGSVTLSYTSPGAAPGYGVTTATMGMLMSGIVSFFSCPADHRPPSVTSTATRITAALLRSENRVMRSMR